VGCFYGFEHDGSTLWIASPDQMPEIPHPQEEHRRTGTHELRRPLLLLCKLLRRRGRHHTFGFQRAIFLAIEIVDGPVNEDAMASIFWDAL
jgi:hypothetical protein